MTTNEPSTSTVTFLFSDVEGSTALLRKHRDGYRAVIGDHQLEIAIGLPRQRTQNRVERIHAIIGRDDDGNQVVHGRSLAALKA